MCEEYIKMFSMCKHGGMTFHKRTGYEIPCYVCFVFFLWVTIVFPWANKRLY